MALSGLISAALNSTERCLAPCMLDARRQGAALKRPGFPAGAGRPILLEVQTRVRAAGAGGDTTRPRSPVQAGNRCDILGGLELPARQSPPRPSGHIAAILMAFSSITFLFLFLPLALGAYYLSLAPNLAGRRSPLGMRFANFSLLLFSLVFYFWGENFLIWIVIASTTIDYVCGLLISGRLKTGERPALDPLSPRTRLQQLGLALSIVSNLAFLGYFKYLNFAIDSVNSLLVALGPAGWIWEQAALVTLPLGISFYTFQSMSYTIDVYRGRVRATRNLLDFACYVTLFPQLVAGPIVRYRDLADQLRHRQPSVSMFARGVERFILGLAKKVIIANTVAIGADNLFALPSEDLTVGLAWLAVVCYTLQIYFDFSGYSDMAIGLGLMLGFRIPENFNYPYVARTVQDFWRRWHISLSTWFRDYLYIPLGGNRGSPARTYFNLLAVFFLCGLWHGASWTFVAWGLYHGLFLSLERHGPLRAKFGGVPAGVAHAYTLIVVMVGWVLFRAETFSQAASMLAAMSGAARGSGAVHSLAAYLRPDLVATVILGVVFSAPAVGRLRGWFVPGADLVGPAKRRGMAPLLRIAVLAAMFGLCTLSLASGTHNPFIYFRF